MNNDSNGVERQQHAVENAVALCAASITTSMRSARSLSLEH